MAELFRTLMLSGAMACAPFCLSVAQADDAVEVAAIDEGNGFDEFMGLFGSLFDTSDLEPIDPARLELATVTAERLVPDGVYGEMIGSMIDDLFGSLLGEDTPFMDMQIAFATGVDGDKVEALDEGARAEILDMLDPARKQRSEAMRGFIDTALVQAMAKVEPALRTGLSRAFARRMTADELIEINAFLSTPTGAKFARETLVSYGDPEVMNASFQIMPELLGSLGPESMESMGTDDLPKERTLGDLSKSELKRMAKLLDVPLADLEAQAALSVEAYDEDSYAEDAVEDDYYLYADPEAWSDEDRQRVDALEAEANAALERYYTAQEEAMSNARGSADAN